MNNNFAREKILKSILKTSTHMDESLVGNIWGDEKRFLIMAFSVSHWSGRLGNNIQQVANCILAAEKHKTDFNQILDHDIIVSP